MGMRAALEKWFDAHDLRPRLVGEFEDSTLMKAAASGALGFTAVHSLVAAAALKHYGLTIIAEVEDCASDFYAITAERRVKHPPVVPITEYANALLFG